MEIGMGSVTDRVGGTPTFSGSCADTRVGERAVSMGFRRGSDSARR
jgi:hypothetical protein